MLNRVFEVCSVGVRLPARLLALALPLIAGCGAVDPSVEPTAEVEQEIVRGTPVPVSALPSVGRPYVVLVLFETYSGQWSSCSGAYFAPRVVLTAAHCVPPANVSRGYVYWGNNFEADAMLRYEIPAPGQPTVWAKLDSWQIHPDYQANPYDADLAVVYVDRKLPFDPLPLYRSRLDSTWTNQQATLVGWGANVALSADIQLNEGFGIKRTGRALLGGTPSAVDYAPNDGLPGTVTATVRSHYVKINGTQPNANACSGDSGGPVIVNKWGQDYVAGVASRTGDWCEGYSLYTRIDPYLPFLDEAYRRGGQAALVPSLDCVDSVGGKLTAYFGYKNDNGVSINVPYDARNALALDVNKERPTTFKSGDNRFQFGIAFNPGQTVSWKLNPPNGPQTEVRATSTSPRCADNKGRRCARYCEASLASECADDFNTNWDTCINACTSGYEQFANSCEPKWANFLACVAATAPAEQNWSCVPWMDTLPRATACDSLIGEALDCLYPPTTP